MTVAAASNPCMFYMKRPAVVSSSSTPWKGRSTECTVECVGTHGGRGTGCGWRVHLQRPWMEGCVHKTSGGVRVITSLPHAPWPDVPKSDPFHNPIQIPAVPIPTPGLRSPTHFIPRTSANPRESLPGDEEKRQIDLCRAGNKTRPGDLHPLDILLRTEFTPTATGTIPWSSPSLSDGDSLSDKPHPTILPHLA